MKFWTKPCIPKLKKRNPAAHLLYVSFYVYRNLRQEKTAGLPSAVSVCLPINTLFCYMNSEDIPKQVYYSDKLIQVATQLSDAKPCPLQSMAEHTFS